MCIIRCKIREENAKLWYSHFSCLLLAGYSEGGAAMNGEVPSVPITTLAGLASLTHCKYLLVLPPQKMMKISCWPPESARNEVILVIFWPQKQSTLQSNWWGLILISFEVALYSLNIFIGSTKAISPTKNKWFFEEKISMGSSYKYIVQYANMMVEQGNCLYITLKIEEERYVSFPSVAL